MKGILFKPDLIPLVVAGTKTETRRLGGLKEINEAPDDWVSRGYVIDWRGFHFTNEKLPTVSRICRPRYFTGETLYIKEAWQFASQELANSLDYDFGVKYTDGEILWWSDNGNEINYPLDEKKRSPLFLPEKFARHFVKVTDVYPERVQEITNAGAKREGVIFEWREYRASYAALFDSINGKGSWDKNLWNFVYKLERVKGGDVI